MTEFSPKGILAGNVNMTLIEIINFLPLNKMNFKDIVSVRLLK